MITYLKLGAILAAVLLLFGAGWYCGSLRSKAILETQDAAQLKAVALAYQNQLTAAAALHDSMQKVIDAYDANKDLPDPVGTGLAHRMYIIQAPGSCPMPTPASVASGTEAPAAEPAVDVRLEQLHQQFINDCTADAEQMKAMIQLAP